jgi:hypothetical protein
MRTSSQKATVVALALLVSALVWAQSTVEVSGRVNPTAFGAKGDGHADDTAALKAVVAGGGTVIFPSGTYLISSTLAPAKKIRLVCEGATGLTGSIHGACRIKKSSAFTGPAIYLGPATQGSLIEGLEIDGAPGNQGDGIQVLANSIALRDVAVVNQGGNGIRIGEDAVQNTTQADTFYLERVRSANNHGHGFYIHKQDVYKDFPDANAGTMINCVAQVNDGDGLRIGKGLDNTFVGFLAEQNAGAGVHLVAGAGNEVFIGGDLAEGNTRGNVVLEAGNVLESYFFGTDTGSTVLDNGKPKSIFWNRSLGLSGPLSIGRTTPSPGVKVDVNGSVSITGDLAVGQSAIQNGTGSPSGKCRPASLYLRTDGGPGSTLYVCETGHWTAK